MNSIQPSPIKPTVPFSTFEALDIRVGTILAIENVGASAKLVRLRVSFGDHVRTILAGLRKERSDVQSLVGRQTLFVVNLEPRTMAGQISEGMLFDVGYADGLLPALVQLEREMPDGTRAG